MSGFRNSAKIAGLTALFLTLRSQAGPPPKTIVLYWPVRVAAMIAPVNLLPSSEADIYQFEARPAMVEPLPRRQGRMG